jgi:hypothetical protein
MPKGPRVGGQGARAGAEDRVAEASGNSFLKAHRHDTAGQSGARGRPAPSTSALVSASDDSSTCPILARAPQRSNPMKKHSPLIGPGRLTSARSRECAPAGR